MKTRNHSPKTRPLLALLIVVATVFLLLGARAGVLGALVADVATRLLGVAGTGLLCVTAWCIAFILATPPGTLTRMVVAIWRHTVARRHSPSVVVMRPKAAEPAVEPAVVSTRGRRALQDVKTALKNLGYEKHEYEPIVAQLDPALPLERLVRSALKALQVN